METLNPSERYVTPSKTAPHKSVFYVDELRNLQIIADEEGRDLYLVTVNGMYRTPFDFSKEKKQFSMIEHDNKQEAKNAIEMDKIQHDISDRQKEYDAIKKTLKKDQKPTKEMNRLEMQIKALEKKLEDIDTNVWQKCIYELVVGENRENLADIVYAFIAKHRM